MLTDDQKRRYARNITLSGIGAAGQEKLLAAKVLVVGAGGLGAPALLYLAAAGVGTLGIADHDRVELSNLQRQVLFETGDTGRLKVEAAADRLSELNPEIRLVTHPRKVTAENATALISAYDIVADCCDNFATRFAVNDACLTLGKPLVSAAIQGWQGQVATFKGYAPGQPCYRCLVPHMPPPEATPTCAENGVLGALGGTMGSLQALEVIKEITGAGTPLAGRMLLLDALTLSARTVQLAKNPGCACAAITHAPAQLANPQASA